MKFDLSRDILQQVPVGVPFSGSDVAVPQACLGVPLARLWMRPLDTSSMHVLTVAVRLQHQTSFRGNIHINSWHALVRHTCKCIGCLQYCRTLMKGNKPLQVRYMVESLQLLETNFTLAVQSDNDALLFCWGQLQNPQTQLASDTVKAEELID